jgi:DNA-binding beta-propeller fold protein YncE
MQVSSDNKNLYVAAGVGDSVASYVRSTKTGHIRQLAGTAGCYTDHAHDVGRCNTGLELDGPEGIAVSPDGDSVYVGSFFSGAVAVFDRVSFTGTITQRTGVNGCIVDVATDGCTTGTALDSANALAISGDGRSVYVGAYGSNAVDVFGRAQPPPGHVAVSVPSRLNVPVGRVVSVPVSCTGSHGRMCPGGISLQPAPNGARTRGGSFNIPAGQRRNVSVALSASTLRYLSSNRSAKVTATLRVIEPTGRVKTFRRQMLLIESELG